MKLLILFILLTQILFSQEQEKKEEPSPRRFNLNIKRMNYTYFPAEYYQSKESTYETIRNSGELKNNAKNIVPMSLTYYHKDWNLYVEASFFKASFANMYYNQYFLPSFATHTNFTQGNFLIWRDNVLRNTMRQEAKLNFYTSKEISESQSIFYGLGIRNINRETSAPRGEFIYADRFDRAQSYGLNAYFKYQLQMFSFLKLKFSLEPFYTVGNRNRDSAFFIQNNSRFSQNPIISFRTFQENPRNYFYGFETDFSLAFALIENLNLNIGMNFIYTKIRYENNRAYSFDTLTSTNRNFLSLINQELLNKVPHESKDHLKGFYIGIDAKF